eukprot:UN29647
MDNLTITYINNQHNSFFKEIPGKEIEVVQITLLEEFKSEFDKLYEQKIGLMIASIINSIEQVKITIINGKYANIDQCIEKMYAYINSMIDKFASDDIFLKSKTREDLENDPHIKNLKGEFTPIFKSLYKDKWKLKKK